MYLCVCVLIHVYINIFSNFIYITMVLLTIVAPSNGHTVYFDRPIKKTNYIRLLSCRLHVSASSSDWFIELSATFVIRQRNCFGVWFYDTRSSQNRSKPK